uniref:Chromosome 20 open reading frame 141 n=1 Tax=Ailuropoda melanoleuca TaxID=9646 RepID=G1LXG2_AILME
MTQLCLPRPKALAYPIPVPPRGLGAGEESHSPVGPCMSPWSPSVTQLWDSVQGALGLTIRTVFSTAGPASLLLLLLVSFLAFDLLHWPAGPRQPQHTLLTGGQSQGAGEGPGQEGAVLLPTVAVTGGVSPQEALGLGLLLGARGVPLALLGLAFCLHPWA